MRIPESSTVMRRSITISYKSKYNIGSKALKKFKEKYPFLLQYKNEFSKGVEISMCVPSTASIVFSMFDFSKNNPDRVAISFSFGNLIFFYLI